MGVGTGPCAELPVANPDMTGVPGPPQCPYLEANGNEISNSEMTDDPGRARRSQLDGSAVISRATRLKIYRPGTRSPCRDGERSTTTTLGPKTHQGPQLNPLHSDLVFAVPGRIQGEMVDTP